MSTIDKEWLKTNRVLAKYNEGAAEVSDDLLVKKDSGVTSLGEVVKVRRVLTASYCRTLGSIGRLKEVGGDANFYGTAITSLEGLAVGGDLVVGDDHLLLLTALGSVGGRVYVGHHKGSLDFFRRVIANWTRYYAGRPERAAFDILKTPKATLHYTMIRAALENKLQQGAQHE